MKLNEIEKSVASVVLIFFMVVLIITTIHTIAIGMSYNQTYIYLSKIIG